MWQKDQGFAQRLNRIRERNQISEDIDFFENIAKTCGAPPPAIPRMFFRNEDVDACNGAVLQNMPGKEYVSRSTDTIDGPLSSEGIKEAHVKLAALLPKDTNKALRELRLKIGLLCTFLLL